MGKNKKNKNTTKKPFFKKWWVWVIVISLGGGILAGSRNRSDIAANNNITTAQGENQQIPAIDEAQTVDEDLPTEAERGEDAIRKAIEKVVGAEYLETFNYVPSNDFSLIKFRGSENLTTRWTVLGMYKDMFYILKAIQPIIDTDVDFNVVYSLQDKYGNAEDVIVIKATFTNATIQKINFDNALFQNIPDLADEWWDHNAVKLSN